MPVRMKDIARDLGVSVVTVSKVLRNHSDISAKTRERVLKRMQELNYRPNLAARALVTGRSGMVGLIVPDLVHPFFAEVAKSLSSALRKKGYGLVISSSEEDPALERQEIDQLAARGVDALIVASTQRSPESFRQIEEIGIPYVLIDRRFPGLAANFVGVDDEEVGRLATEHLLAAGCRLIAHIRGPEVSTALGRLEGYKKALAGHGLEVREEYIVAGQTIDNAADVSGYRAMRKLLQLTPHPDGVFCYNDPLAVGALKAILEAGLLTPEDVALAGCGNVRFFDHLRAPLTSVDQDSAAIGDRAAKLALSLIESKTPAKPKTILLTPKLIARDSSRRAN